MQAGGDTRHIGHHHIQRQRRAFSHRLLGLAMLSSLLVGLTFPVRAIADVGVPPWALQAAALSHGEGTTHVQMVSEDVVIRVEEEQNDAVFTYSNERYAASQLIGRVSATFLMQNKGDEVEAFDVWFPLWLPNYPWGAQVVPVQAFRVWVDGRAVTAQTVVSQDSTGMGLEEGQPWAVWPVQFPPGEFVEIRVVYDGYPAGELPYASFTYILETGADWDGAIGSGRVTYILPYDVDETNVLPPEGEVLIDGNEVTLSFEDLDPTEEDNVSLVMLAPDVWRDVESARANVEVDPGSSLAQLAYAHASMSGVRVMKAYALTTALSGFYTEEALDAFETALSINADAFMVHDAVTYLSLLSYVRAYEAWDPSPELLGLLSRTLSRQPGAYPEVVEYLQMLSYKWNMAFWTEEDGTPHAPGSPGEDLLMLVAQVDELSPEPLDDLTQWVIWSYEGIPAEQPTAEPITEAMTGAERVDPAGTAEAEATTQAETAGNRVCTGSASLVILPLVAYTLSRKQRRSNESEQ